MYDLEGSLYPWSRNETCQNKKINKLYLDHIFEKPLEDGAFLYFKAKLPDGFILPIFNEYAVNRGLYEKFGLTPLDLADLDAEWVDMQIQLMNSENKANRLDT